MKPAIFSVGLLIVVAAFSGCAGKGDKLEATPTDVPTTSSPSATPTISTTSTPESTSSPTPEPTVITDPPPGPPVATLTADITNGSIPVNVTFTIDDSSDEGGNYEWTIEFGDGTEANGTGPLPTVATHSFTEIGEYQVNLTLANEAGVSNATLNITANDFAAQRWSGEWEFGVVACLLGPQHEWEWSDFNETSHVEFPVDNTTWNMTFSAAFDPANSMSRMVDFYDEDMERVASFQESRNATVNGTVPQNATLVVLWACDRTRGGSAEYAAAPKDAWDRQPREAPREDE